MKKEMLEIWIAALRSGEYKQGTAVLAYYPRKGTTEFCCLGVLNQVCALGSDSSLGKIRPDIRESIGLTGNLQSTLIRMNDEENKTFNEIADFLSDIASEAE